MEKIIPKSRLRKCSDIDTVATTRKGSSDSRCFDLLMKAQQYWMNLDTFRRERNRNKRYTYGDQWSDIVHVDGKWMSEEQYIKKQGSVPLKNNHIRRLVRDVLGAYRKQTKEPTCTARDRNEQAMCETMSVVLQYNWQINHMAEMNARTIEEFLIGGLVVHKKSCSWRNEKFDCWTDYINPNNFFIDNTMRDFRGWDCSLIGEIHDISYGELLKEFATSPKEYQRLKDIYKVASDRRVVADSVTQFGHSDIENLDFLMPEDISLCRVIEVWTKETKPRIRCHDYLNGEIYKIEEGEYHEMVYAENMRRLEQGRSQGIADDDIPLIEVEWFVDDYWYCRYLSPFGDVLRESETPFAHKSHPYVFKMYPYIDGEIHSFVSDVIDQQRYINRLITLYDFIIRSSAKGLLLFPEECLPDGMSIEDVAEEWSRFDGMLLIKTKNATQLPQQISANSTHIGINEVLQMQLKFFEDISGVHGALQGKPGYSGMSASLYAQQAQNSTTSLLDLFDSYSSFVMDGAYKDVKNIQQYYDTKRIFDIAGATATVGEHDRIRDIEMDVSITESTSTPNYRQIANDFLMQIWQTGQISLEQLLEHGDFPFADNLLQSIQAQKEQLSKGQTPEGISPQLSQQVAQGADMNAVNQLQSAMRG